MTKPARVLLADDNSKVAEALELLLTLKGYSVATCSNGAKAIELIKAGDFDILITDIQMPKIDGFALLEWVGKHHPELKVIVISGLGAPAVRERAVRKGASVFIEKPILPDTLMHAMTDHRRDLQAR